jgi:hypothetical protein
MANNDDIFTKCIRECDYIKKCCSNEQKEVHSLSFLVSRKLSQSDCIKLGHGFEKCLHDVIKKHNNKELEDIKPKNSKNKKEKDHLFKDEVNKVIYYAELKSNLNLDTEKSVATYKKCQDIEKELTEQYPEYTIIMKLLSNRHYTTENIPDYIRGKYEPISDNLIGVNEYLTLLGVEYQFDSEEQYKEKINLIADEMFKEKPKKIKKTRKIIPKSK